MHFCLSCNTEQKYLRQEGQEIEKKPRASDVRAYSPLVRSPTTKVLSDTTGRVAAHGLDTRWSFFNSLHLRIKLFSVIITIVFILAFIFNFKIVSNSINYFVYDIKFVEWHYISQVLPLFLYSKYKCKQKLHDAGNEFLQKMPQPTL